MLDVVTPVILLTSFIQSVAIIGLTGPEGGLEGTALTDGLPKLS